MKTLNIDVSTECLKQQNLDAYAMLFRRQPLSDTHVQALASLFGWVVLEEGADPPVGGRGWSIDQF
jgi:hypothetical protein